MIRDQLASRLRAIVGSDGVIDHPTQLRTYECDGLAGYRAVPGLAVLPITAEQVAGVVRACQEARVPFVARGSGTGLSGGALPLEDAVLLVMSRFNRILDIDYANRTVVGPNPNLILPGQTLVIP